MKFYTWVIKDRDGNTKKELKLRMGAREIAELEDKIGGNPVNEIILLERGKLPTMRFLAENLRAALKKFEHGYDINKVYDLIEEYIEEGNTTMDLLKELLEVYKVSGFFKKEPEM